MLELTVGRNLDNGKVLISAKDMRTPQKTQECYAVKEENADRFIKERKGLDFTSGFHKNLTVATSIVSAVLAGSYIKSGYLGKCAAGLLAGIGIYEGLSYVDKGIDKKSMENLLKRNEAEIMPIENVQE